ncbi:hypothetical protein LZ554_002041 [Drepanopeziza brunnea f. sp. 'monogermtubi']|nr:hypothetical protein LZ554_002041 [Drepanopeziza brunnea f. sp. 'monogermtubi']
MSAGDSRQFYTRMTGQGPEPKGAGISHVAGAQAATDYCYRAPSPPHISVPQPQDDLYCIQLAPSFKAAGHDADENAILHTIISSYALQDLHVPMRDWDYPMRRKSQSILSFLQLGPSSATRDLETLRKDGVTMLLVIRNTSSAQARLLSGDKSARALGIESCAVDVASNSELIAAFPRATKIINDHLIARYRMLAADTHGAVPMPCGKVLVFCESGNERSAAFVVAYIMAMLGLDMVKAMQYVQALRFCTAFDDGLKNLLLNYHDILVAQRSFGEDEGQMTSRSKRSRDEVEDEDENVEMGQVDDRARFEGRTPFAPFR